MPSGHSYASLTGCHSQDGVGTERGWKPIGGDATRAPHPHR
jgi:hypothetical protein